MKTNTYTFEDVWSIRADSGQLYAVLKDIDHWQEWWPGLKHVEILQFNDDITGSQAIMTWRAPFGYDLTFKVIVTDYQAGERLTFTVSGDIVGEGTWDMAENESVITLKMTLKARTAKKWMANLAPVLRPVFVLAHNVLMRRGEKGLAKRVASVKV